MSQTLIPTTVKELRARWESLHDLDRAEAVRGIHETGKSIRSIATELGYRSEAHLRTLLKAAKAPLADRILAREGKITMSELAQRSVVKLSDDQLRDKECKKWSISICRWLQEEKFSWAHQDTILEEARRDLMLEEVAGGPPSFTRPKAVSLAQVIERTRPRDQEDEIEIAYYARWLARWICVAVPTDLRDAALADAIRMTHRGQCVTPKPKKR